MVVCAKIWCSFALLLCLHFWTKVVGLCCSKLKGNSIEAWRKRSIFILVCLTSTAKVVYIGTKVEYIHHVVTSLKKASIK
eukprot:04193.XXX_195572_195811_1 [CDS] Oithona nana genome sequencing.